MPGRNAPCVCGSGKKYKRCCGRWEFGGTLGEGEGFSVRSSGAVSGVQCAGSSGGSGVEVTSQEMDWLVGFLNTGRYAQMESAARELLGGRPRAGMVWKALGIALWAQGKDALEALESAARLMPEDAEVRSDLGTALRGVGRLEEAVGCYRRALEIEPRFAEAHNNLGGALRDLGRLEEAAQSYRRALEFKPDFATAHANLGDVLLAMGYLAAAESSCRRALELDPMYAEGHNNLGMTLRQQGRHAEAEASCRRALQIDPKLVAGIVLLGQLKTDRGEFTEAEELFRRALLLDRNSSEAWAGIAGLRKMTREGDADWMTGAQRLLERRLPVRQEIQLRYAMGKYFDDVREFEQAFAQYQRANELQRRHGAGHDRQGVSRAVDRIIEFYDREWVNRERGGTEGSGRAVLIVGMPRSGTTLTEQILASHPQVFGAGELSFWSGASTRFAALRDEGLVGGLAKEYLQRLRELSGDAARVVDKMPDNFKHLGLICAALPQARIIHLRRSPIDTCLSIYFQDMHAAHSYANDLEDLAHYYGEYERLMNHWRAVLPEGVMLEVPYEKLTAEPEGWSRRIVEFVGLPWDAACLESHRTARTIITFSRWQARQKINTASVERWRNYQPFIAPLLSAG
jgi:tetratricopeptide (TPR) repeat protein